MRINNQMKVGIATIICLISQGYIFTHVLKVEPNPVISFIPLLPYIAYIYARESRTWYFNKPIYWIAIVIALTVIDIAPFVLGLG
jgi:ABC-type iron transport system FetAB permease component